MNVPLRIVSRTNGVGIDRDVRLLLDVLAAAGVGGSFSHYRSVSPLRRFFGRPNPRETLLFNERITRRWLRHAGCYLLVPNQERFPRRHVPLLRSIDHILCKSRHAVEIFSRFHASVHCLGFTSEDRLLPAVRPDYGRFLHLAGRSSAKGTAGLLQLWAAHPEWPTLELIQHPSRAPRSVPANVRLHARYLADAELRHLQNVCGMQLCPSESEGWGHYIVEAMSCRAVTVVTDAPPMNELVQPDCGVLVAAERIGPRRMGENFRVKPHEMEQAILGLLALPAAEKVRLGEAARSWFETNDRAFRERLPRILVDLKILLPRNERAESERP